MTLGQRIQAGRNALELSQEGLGEKLGVSRQAVSKWEADAAVPDTDKLIALSKLFGMTLNELLQVEEPGEKPKESASKTLASLKAPKMAVIAVAVILAFMAVDLVGLHITLGKLSRQMEVLEEKISPTVLDPDKELVFDLSYDMTMLSDEKMQYVFRLTPAQQPQGLEVTYLLAVGNPETIREVPATRYGYIYGALGSLGADGEWAGDGAVTVTARFTDGQGNQREADLVRFEHERAGSFRCVELWNTK